MKIIKKKQIKKNKQIWNDILSDTNVSGFDGIHKKCLIKPVYLYKDKKRKKTPFVVFK